MQGLSRSLCRWRRGLGQVPEAMKGGEDVIRVTVQVLASPVIPHGGPRVCMAGSDLNVAQVDPSVEHGRDEGVAKHLFAAVAERERVSDAL